jgi:hypothetical protein
VKSIQWQLFLTALAGLLAGAARAGVNPAAPTSAWTVIGYGPAGYPDPSGDQQTGSAEGDLVGNAANPSFYAAFDNGGTPALFTDGQLAFRLRVGADKNPPGYSGCAFVGMDLDGNGSLDLFAGVNNSGAKALVGLWWAGSGSNLSPSTTTIAGTPTFSYAETAANYSWMAVTLANNPGGTSTDVDGAGQTDYFLSFVVPFADVVAMAHTQGLAGFDEHSTLSYVAATATQANSLNQDVNGAAGGVNSSDSWASLGAISTPSTVGGLVPVPEPSVLALVSLGLGGLAVHYRRRPRRQRARH